MLLIVERLTLSTSRTLFGINQQPKSLSQWWNIQRQDTRWIVEIMFGAGCSHMFSLNLLIMKNSKHFNIISNELNLLLLRCVISLIRGLQGLCPCPKCLIPKDKLTDHGTVYAKRTPAQTISRLNQAAKIRKTSKTDAEELLKELSLRPHIVSYIIWITKYLLSTSDFNNVNRVHFSYLPMQTHIQLFPLMIFIMTIVGLGRITYLIH